jgi:rubrerythrin
MLQIICPNCNKENEFPDENQISSECWACAEGLATGLTLVSRQTNRKIEIPLLPVIILGRENTGADIFRDFRSNGEAVISRRHSSIEYRDGNFYLKDEGSVNGTFYSENKINCRDTPQRIENNGLIFFGKEPFTVKMTFHLIEKQSESKLSSPLEEIRKVKKYRCKSCGTETEIFSEDCPNCSTFDSLVEIYEQ